MLRSMMQVFVRDSISAVEQYRKAFGAALLCGYKDPGDRYYEHAELDVLGQVLAVSETDSAAEASIPGTTMMFCLELGEGGEKTVKQAYEVLRVGAQSATVPAPCSYSSCQTVIIDRFGVRWCIYV